LKALLLMTGPPLSHGTSLWSAGHIKLELPVFHIGYFKHTIAILQCICKRCARVMVVGDDRAAFLRKMRNPRTEVLQRAAQLKKLNEKCKRTKICPHCGEANGTRPHTSLLRKARQALSGAPLGGTKCRRVAV
jgi:DNA-directed RNA polymerase beta' subunit